MRKRFQTQLELGQIAIEDVVIPLKSRDELPPILAGLQWIFTTPAVSEEIFALLEKHLVGDKKDTGRPGMDLWHLLVLGVIRLGLDCDYDRLEHVANYDTLVRQLMGVTATEYGGRRFHHKTLSENTCRLDEELLAQINHIVVAHGHRELKKNAAEKLALKTDSYVLETNVHFPTDLNLLWDASRKCIELLHQLGAEGWRKDRDWKSKIKSLMRQAAKVSSRGGQQKEERTRAAVGAYLNKARELSAKVTLSVGTLQPQIMDVRDQLKLEQVRYFQGCLDKHIDLVDRRLLQDQKIPHEEKVFSLFEPHTEWIAKGKSRPAVELGHQLLLTTDQRHLIVDYKVMEKSRDAAETMPLAKRLFERFGEDSISSHSFDKGFSRVSDREELEQRIPLVVMPKKGKASAADRAREQAAPFVKKRRAHSAVESNINSLEHHGLNRCPDKGLSGFKRYVGLGVLSYNLHRIGQAKIAQTRKATARAARKKERAEVQELAA